MRLVLALAACLLVTPVLNAQDENSAPPPQPQAPQPTTAPEGRAFGEHVSGMAPEHAILHGALFGECVSEMAITGECPHHEDDEE